MKRENLLKLPNPVLLNSQKTIELLKYDFLLRDLEHNTKIKNGESAKIVMSKSKIVANVIVGKSISISQDEFGFDVEHEDLNYEVEEIDFYDEFKRALNNKIEIYSHKFLRELDRKGIYTAVDLEGFKNNKLRIINDLISDLYINSNVEKRIKESLEEFYGKLYEFIDNFRFENDRVNRKLKFKLNRNQLIWLFVSMYEKGVISGISQLDLFSILETNSMYYDNGEYKEMTGIRIQGNKLINGNASPESSIAYLNKTFDDNFFSSIR